MTVARDPHPAERGHAPGPAPQESVFSRMRQIRAPSLLSLLLALGFFHGLLYVAVFPPWQHYDEPTHFEYIRLIAERGRLPKTGDFDLAMRQEIAASMQATGFWKNLQTPPIDFWSKVPPSIGVSELYHPPLYYALLAIPQLLVEHQSVEVQLYVARSCSVVMYLIFLASAYGVVAEAFPRRRWFPAAVTAFLALLPPLADIMSSVNNDVGATAASALFLYACIRMARRGPSLRRAASCAILAVTCLAFKTTAGAVALSVLAALGISYIPKVYRRWILLAGAVFLAVVLSAAIAWQGYAAAWYSGDSPGAPNRLAVPTPLGRWALVLSASGQKNPRMVFQELYWSTGQSLQGHTVTFGAWLRAPEGASGLVALDLDDGLTDHWFRVQATGDWQFHAFTTTLGVKAPGVAAYVVLPEQSGAAHTVFVDGLALVDGAMPVAVVPTFRTGQMVDWGGTVVENLLRNASAEHSWPGLRGWIGNRTVFREPAARVFWSVLDWNRTGWVYGREASVLFTSFWGSFGWNHLVLPRGYFYPLAALSALGVGGFVLSFAQLRRRGGLREPSLRRTWLVLSLALLVGWGEAVLRVHPVLVTKHVSWPVARYADVVIVPTAVVLCLGWMRSLPHRWARAAAFAGLLGLLLLDALALGTVILPYYYGPL